MGQYFIGDKVRRTKYSIGMVGEIIDTLSEDSRMYMVKVLHSHNSGLEEGMIQRWSRIYFEPWFSDSNLKPKWEV